MKSLNQYINESKRLSDLKGKRVGKIEVSDYDGCLRIKIDKKNVEAISEYDSDMELKDYDKMFALLNEYGNLTYIVMNPLHADRPAKVSLKVKDGKVHFTSRNKEGIIIGNGYMSEMLKSEMDFVFGMIDICTSLYD